MAGNQCLCPALYFTAYYWGLTSQNSLAAGWHSAVLGRWGGRFAWWLQGDYKASPLHKVWVHLYRVPGSGLKPSLAKNTHRALLGHFILDSHTSYQAQCYFWYSLPSLTLAPGCCSTYVAQTVFLKLSFCQLRHKLKLCRFVQVPHVWHHWMKWMLCWCSERDNRCPLKLQGQRKCNQNDLSTLGMSMCYSMDSPCAARKKYSVKTVLFNIDTGGDRRRGKGEWEKGKYCNIASILL